MFLRSLFFALLAFCLAGCATVEPLQVEDNSLAKHFEGMEACFVMKELTAGTVWRYNPARAAERFSPCSTFKIPNSMIALQEGIVRDTATMWKWDGVLRSREETNRDQNLRSAMRDSVVWYFQEVARRVGEARYRHWLRELAYGNEDTSAGLTEFWLDSSLKISAEEQVAFLERFVRGELPFDRWVQESVRDILVQDATTQRVHRGKTGSARGRDGGPDLGWYVGWVEGENGRIFVFACNVSGKGQWGPEVRKIVEAILTERRIL